MPEFVRSYSFSVKKVEEWHQTDVASVGVSQSEPSKRNCEERERESCCSTFCVCLTLVALRFILMLALELWAQVVFGSEKD